MPPPADNEPSSPPIPLRILLRRLIALAWRHRVIALFAGLITIALQLLAILGLSGQGIAIDLIHHQVTPEAPAPKWPFGLAPPASWSFMDQILLLGGLILAITLSTSIFRYFGRVVDELFVQQCVVDLRTTIYDKLQRLSFRFFDTHDTGQIINRVTGDTQAVRSFIQGVMVRSVVALASLGVFLVFMLKQHATLTLACLSVLPFQVWMMVRYGRKTKPMFTEQARLVDVLIHHFSESIAGVRVIRAFGREKETVANLDRKSADARDQRITIAKDQGRYQPLVQATNMLAQGVLVGYGGFLVLKGELEGGIALGTLWIFRGLLEQLAGQAEAIVQIIASTPEALAGAERVFKLIDEPVTIGSKSDARIAADRQPLSVSFENVTFGYEPDRPVLRNITFAAQPGETIAIVGPTGSGKSTLLSLIARFHDPQSGRVVIDGTDARDWDLHSLRRSIGVVFQEPFLFSNTIRNNIAYGLPEAPIERINEAVASASAADVIGEATNGLDTVVGERGISLSGGQRQRLTIARALVLHAPILILDDATGAVDAVTESSIQQSLDRTEAGRTTFVVAHRLSTLRRADRIIVLDNGEIADIGTHDDLIDRPGHYRAAALIQLALNESESTDESEVMP